MTTLNIPTISRKKRGPSTYNAADSFHKVLGDAAMDKHFNRPADVPESNIRRYDKTLHLPSWYFNSHYEPERNIRSRNNCSVTYLRRNVRTLNEPVCYVPSVQQGNHWWPSGVPNQDKPNPPKIRDSTMRSDFDWSSQHDQLGSRRHKHNVKKATLGSVPINWLEETDGRQRFHKEKMSYEHQYDSRWERNYPLRGKRHGAFVNENISEERAKRMLDNAARWRTDSNLKTVEPETREATSLPNLGGKVRVTDAPNAKRRQHFDIAPRSNLNVRIREYIPTITSSAPVHTEERTEQITSPKNSEVAIETSNNTEVKADTSAEQ